MYQLPSDSKKLVLLPRFYHLYMEVFETKDRLAEYLSCYRSAGYSIGFVPTMGALHAGHISLVERCREENGITVVSIFVNPTQFNDRNDLAAYPRTLDDDLRHLLHSGCNAVFAPSVEEMYPEEDARVFDFGLLDKVMEGAFRPGHFNGVAQIVSRLFDAVQPVRAYFGEKDFQQLAIIRHMVVAEKIPVQIVGCPIVREADGLAMSSRNVRLSPEQRQNAPVIARALFFCRDNIGRVPLGELKKQVIEQINSIPGFQTEYFDIVNRLTLQSVSTYSENALQACIAVRVGSIRLIDNISL